MEIDGIGVGASDRFKLGFAFGDPADARQIEAEVSERMNQLEASESRLIVPAVAGPSPQRLRHQTDVCVVANGLDRQACDVRHFAD